MELKSSHDMYLGNPSTIELSLSNSNPIQYSLEVDRKMILMTGKIKQVLKISLTDSIEENVRGYVLLS